ncbi:MAG TPA: hypothetical protein VEY89_07400, partial [Candidatus Dormibacteraeota bacterium]|nr:hypothetical protein [Candidatus Dormibacteraeota bacterium]
ATGSYIGKLSTTEPVTCSALSSAALEGTSAKSFSITWNEMEGVSSGSLILPLSETPLTGLAGTINGGPFATPTNLKAGSVVETFAGGPTCGQQVGKHKPKAVKSGTFSTGEVEFS